MFYFQHVLVIFRRRPHTKTVMFMEIDRLQSLVDSENVNQDLITTAEGVCKVSVLIVPSPTKLRRDIVTLPSVLPEHPCEN
jgi:hypothetical protein